MKQWFGERHYMTTAAVNAAKAMSMAKELWSREEDVGQIEDVQALVKAHNAISIGIILACKRIGRKNK